MSDFDKWFKDNFKDLHDAVTCGDLLAKSYRKAIKKTWSKQQKIVDEKIKYINHIRGLMDEAASLIREGDDSDALELLK